MTLNVEIKKSFGLKLLLVLLKALFGWKSGFEKMDMKGFEWIV